MRRMRSDPPWTAGAAIRIGCCAWNYAGPGETVTGFRAAPLFGDGRAAQWDVVTRPPVPDVSICTTGEAESTRAGREPGTVAAIDEWWGCGMSDESDEALMSAYASGSPAAFDELFRRYERRAWAFFRRRVASADRASDLYQELFLRVHRFRDTYDPSRAFAPWFFQVARNVLIDDTRRAFRAREQPLGDDVSATPEGDAERTVAARESAAQQLGELTEEGARVLVGSKLLGQDYGEIAREIGKTRDAVKQIASRSLRRLRGASSPTG